MSKRPWGYQPRSERPDPNWTLDPQTQAVRAGLARSGFGETSEALYLTSGFTYSNAEEAEEAKAREQEMASLKGKKAANDSSFKTKEKVAA